MKNTLMVEQPASAIINDAYDAIVGIHLFGEIASWNKAAERIFGFTEEEFVGRHFSYLLALKNPDINGLLNQIKKGFQPQPMEAKGITKAGRVIDISLTVSPIKNEIGAMVGSSVFIRDISELVQMSQDLKKSNLDLEYRVIQRTKEISDINAKLMRSLHEKDILLREIHHRVKNNLQVISSLIKLEISQNQKSAETVEAIQNRLKTFALVHEKLYGSKDISQIDFKKYVNDLFKYLSRSVSAGNTNVSLRTDIGSVQLDMNIATNLGLILNELISNAIKHSAGNNTIIISLKKNTEYILKVSNLGSPKHHIDINNPKSMGLTLVLALVDQLDGKIQLNTEGKTEFVITFPVKEKWKIPE